MTASFLMLTALLVSLNNILVDANCCILNPSDFPRLLLEPGLPPVSELQLSLLELRRGSPLCYRIVLRLSSLFPGVYYSIKI